MGPRLANEGTQLLLICPKTLLKIFSKFLISKEGSEGFTVQAVFKILCHSPTTHSASQKQLHCRVPFQSVLVVGMSQLRVYLPAAGLHRSPKSTHSTALSAWGRPVTRGGARGRSRGVASSRGPGRAPGSLRCKSWTGRRGRPRVGDRGILPIMQDRELRLREVRTFTPVSTWGAVAAQRF